MRIVISVDVEEDCPPYGHTTRGIEEGLPPLLDLLKEENIRATLFFTGKMAEEFPEMVREAVRRGHEIGSHGYSHRRLDRMEKKEAVREIERSLDVLKRHYPVTSFRAPNLQLPDNLFPVLEGAGITIDSSKAIYKGWKGEIKRIGNVLEIPVSMTSSVLRLPWRIQKLIHDRLGNIRVYFVHPWEFVPMRGFRPDCTFNTGKKALDLLEQLISYHRDRGAEFLTLKEMAHLFKEKGEGVF